MYEELVAELGGLATQCQQARTQLESKTQELEQTRVRSILCCVAWLTMRTQSTSEQLKSRVSELEGKVDSITDEIEEVGLCGRRPMTVSLFCQGGKESRALAKNDWT